MIYLCSSFSPFVSGHHNLPMFVLGGALIWGGWYSFNAGSAYRAGPQAAVAMMNTHISASSGAAVWILCKSII
jgi:Amt family ammonium transporter